MQEKKNKKKVDVAAQLLQQQSAIAKQAQKERPQNYTLNDVKVSYKNRDELYGRAKEATKDFKRLGKLDSMVGRKMRKTIIDELGIPLNQITAQDQKALDYLLIEDDFVESLKNFATSAGQFVKPYVKPMLKQFAPSIYPLIKTLLPNDETVNKGEGVRIRRRYLLTTVRQPVANTVQSVSVNPGLAHFGQWLSVISRAYQFYQVHGLTFEYVTSTALTTAGNIAYYLEMDKNAPAPGAADIGQQYKSTMHALYQNSSVHYAEQELHQMVKRFHVRNENISVDELSIYDVGNFYYLCSTQTETAVGQFYVDIDISFHVPTLQGLTNSLITQYMWGADSSLFKLPENTLFPLDTNAIRLIETSNAYGYTITKTGRLYMLYIGNGSNGNTVTTLTPYTASSVINYLTKGTTLTNRVSNVSGSKVYVIFYQIDVVAGNLLWVARNNTDEVMNQNHNVFLSYDPNAFPIGTVSQYLERKTQYEKNQTEYLEREKEMKAQIEKQNKTLAYVISKLDPKKQPIFNESFDFD